MPIIDLSKSNIYDAGKRYQAVGAPAFLTRIIRNKDGEVARDKYPPQKHMKWVDRDGNVVRIVMANGPGDQPTNTPYWNGKRELLKDAGAIPYGVCPFTSPEGQMWMPSEMRNNDRACDPLLFGPGREFGEHRACSHVEEIIAMRQANTTRANEINEERQKSQRQRDAEQRQQREEALLSYLVQEKVAARGGDKASLLDEIANDPEMMKLLMQKASTKAAAKRVSEESGFGFSPEGGDDE